MVEPAEHPPYQHHDRQHQGPEMLAGPVRLCAPAPSAMDLSFLQALRVLISQPNPEFAMLSASAVDPSFLQALQVLFSKSNQAVMSRRVLQQSSWLPLSLLELQLIHLQLPTSVESASSVLAASTLAAKRLLLAALAQ